VGGVELKYLAYPMNEHTFAQLNIDNKRSQIPFYERAVLNGAVCQPELLLIRSFCYDIQKVQKSSENMDPGSDYNSN